jgi:hypothetical protein
MNTYRKGRGEVALRLIATEVFYRLLISDRSLLLISRFPRMQLLVRQFFRHRLRQVV